MKNEAVVEPESKELAPQQPNSVATPMQDMFLQDAGAGLQNLGANDFAIPFLTILQKGSPQASRANAKYLKGAEAGMIMNTVTAELFKGEVGIPYIPCGYQKQMVRWKSRDTGGGLVCHYLETDPTLKTFKRNERGQLYDEASGDVIIDTAYHFGILLKDSGFPEFAVIGMSSTQLKKSRNWNTIMRQVMIKTPDGRVFNPPSFSHIYRLTTIGEQKDQYDWYGWNIVSEGQVKDADIYKLARKFSDDVVHDRVRVSMPPQEFEAEGTTEKSDVPF